MPTIACAMRIAVKGIRHISAVISNMMFSHTQDHLKADLPWPPMLPSRGFKRRMANLYAVSDQTSRASRRHRTLPLPKFMAARALNRPSSFEKRI